MPLQVDDQTEQTCAYSEKSLNMQQEMHLRNKSVWLQLIVLSVLEGSRH